MTIDQSYILHVFPTATYLAWCLGLSVICNAATVIVINIALREEHVKVSKNMRRMARFLARTSFFTGCCCKRKVAPSSDDVVKDGVAKDFAMHDSEDDCTVSIYDEDYVFAWPEIAHILDWFLFIYMLLINTVSTLAFMVALSLGGSVSS